MMGLLNPRSHTDVVISAFVFDIKNFDRKNYDNDDIVSLAEKIFAMVASIVQTAKTKFGQKPEFSKRDMGNGIMAQYQYKEAFANTCLIEPNIQIYHHDGTEHGLNGCELTENIAWITFGGKEIFRAKWALDGLDEKSISLSLSRKTKQAFALIYQKWEQLA
jgi:hypothetical protein